MVVLRRTGLVLVLVFLLGSWQGESAAQDFTKRQAADGRKAYRASCAACHGAKLEGIDFAPTDFPDWDRKKEDS